MKPNEDALLLKNQLCFPLYAASRLTTQLYHPMLEEMGLTYPQYLVLLVLWEHDTQTVSSITQMLYLESNTVTPLLQRMEQKELITRSRNKEDEREVIISLTRKGKLLKKKAYCIPQKMTEGLEGGEFTLQEIIHFQKTLGKLVKTLAGTQKKKRA